MATVKVRNRPNEVHGELRLRVAARGCNPEGEIRDILESERIDMGAELAALGRDLELSDSDVAAIEQTRDRIPAEPVRFE